MKKLIALLLLLPGVVMAQPYAVSKANITNAILAPITEASFASKYQMMLMLDANQVTTPTDGTQQNWIDVSGNGNHATNATAGNRLIWYANSLNNHPGFRGNGTSQFLMTPGFLNGSFNSNITVFVVASHKVGTAHGGPLSLGDFVVTGPGTNTVSFDNSTASYTVSANENGLGAPAGGLTHNAGMFDMSAPFISSWVYSSTNCFVGMNGCVIHNDTVGSGVGTTGTYPYNSRMTPVRTFISFGNASIAQPVGVGLSFLYSLGQQALWDGDIHEILIFKGSFTDDEHAQMVKYLQKKWSLDAQTIFFAGDSNCYGYGTPNGDSYASRTMNLLGGLPYASVTNQFGYTAVNVGFSGSSVSSNANLIANGTGAGLVNLFPFQFQRMIKPGDIAVLQGLSNDGSRGVTTNECYANYLLWCKKVRQAGGIPIATTVLPRTSIGGTVDTNQFEIWRIGINSLIRANWPKVAGALADWGADPTIGTFQSSSNLLYYIDGNHLSSLGAAYAATNLAVAIQSVTGIVPNIGINPVITVSASPFSYTNLTGAKHLVFVNGGTVTAVAINGSTVFALSNVSVPLQNGDYVTVTYSSAPTISRKFY